MGSAIQAGDSAISRCRNRELNTAEPDTAEAQESWLGPDPGTGREVYVPAPPASSVTRTLRPETRARREPAQTGAQAIPPARCRRVINVQLANAINGQLRSLRSQSSCLPRRVIERADCSACWLGLCGAGQRTGEYRVHHLVETLPCVDGDRPECSQAFLVSRQPAT
jgi:hypothetical protein